MKKGKAFILVCILAFLFAACTEEVPMSVNIDAGQFEMAFEGEIGRKALLQMKMGAKVSLKGFSFVYADPKITKKLNLYEEYIKGMRKWSKDAQQYQRSVTNGINAVGGGFIYMLVIRRAMDDCCKLDAQLVKQKNKMTAKQLECYQACHKELLSYGPKTWI